VTGKLNLPSAYRLSGGGRGPVALDLPRCLFLEVTNRCNLRCRSCPHTFSELESPRTLAWADFLRVVEQFPNLERVVLHGIGEPLLNPELPRMVAHLKGRGATVLFNSNGVLLDEEIGRALIDGGLDELRISMDAAHTDSYARIRGEPLLGRIEANLHRFTRLQRQMGAAIPRVSLWMTGMRENLAELPALVRLAGQVGVTEVYLQRLVYYLDKRNPPGLMSTEHALSPDGDAVMEIIVEAEAAARELGVTLRASGATDPRGSLAELGSAKPRPWAECRRPWTTSYVTANGNCLPCCMGPFATADYGSLIVGNLFETDFSRVWNGESYRDWRSSLLHGQAPVPCTGCGVHWSL